LWGYSTLLSNTITEISKSDVCNNFETVLKTRSNPPPANLYPTSAIFLFLPCFANAE
jgi:hypothetical protein